MSARTWSPPSVQRLAVLLTLAVVVTGFGVASLWVVFEQDIYWQVRAGDELWRTWRLPHTDTWSYSARGEPWLNVQWLSTLLLRLAYACGAERGLVLARGVGVVALLGIVASIVLRAARGAS
ncbi:MAG TPA: hypothetical protein VFH51_21060, partial [Myxococcota bacterium]|nr:hypothetical protein [Myxococcota bacterium]